MLINMHWIRRADITVVMPYLVLCFKELTLLTQPDLLRAPTAKMA
jgi:hypothetical protein